MATSKQKIDRINQLINAMRYEAALLEIRLIYNRIEAYTKELIEKFTQAIRAEKNAKPVEFKQTNTPQEKAGQEDIKLFKRLHQFIQDLNLSQLVESLVKVEENSKQNAYVITNNTLNKALERNPKLKNNKEAKEVFTQSVMKPFQPKQPQKLLEELEIHRANKDVFIENARNKIQDTSIIEKLVYALSKTKTNNQIIDNHLNHFKSAFHVHLAHQAMSMQHDGARTLFHSALGDLFSDNLANNFAHFAAANTLITNLKNVQSPQRSFINRAASASALSELGLFARPASMPQPVLGRVVEDSKFKAPTPKPTLGRVIEP